MIDIDALKRDKRPQSSTIVHALIGRLEAAESEALEEARLNGMGSERELALMAKLEAAEKERDECNRRRLEAADHFSAQTALMKKKYDALRAKIARMEQQEPVATAIKKGADRYWMSERMSSLPDGTHPLYALPGTQPAQSVPDWLPVPDKHPTFDPVDLQLADGSVLCGCVPQSDGDYWWEGPSGEVFIDPR
jgi:hypothetical protein